MLTPEQIKFAKQHTKDRDESVLICEVVQNGEMCLCEINDAGVAPYYAAVETLSGAQWFFEGRNSGGFAYMSNTAIVPHARLRNLTLITTDGEAQLIALRPASLDYRLPVMVRAEERQLSVQELEMELL